MFDREPMPPTPLNVTPATVDELLELFDEPFIDTAYHVVLRRIPDADGRAYYLRRLREGVHRMEILAKLRASKEGQRTKATLADLDEKIRHYKRPMGWFWGRLFARRQIANARGLNAAENNMQRVARESAAQFAAMRAELARSRDAVAVQFQTLALALAIEKAGDPMLDPWCLAASLVQAADADFLEQLVGMALGRLPFEHELLHYLHLLQAGASKSHIANQLFGAEESRRRRASRVPAAVLVQIDEEPVAARAAVPQSPIIPTGRAAAGVSLQFVRCADPVVSVVIPVYGQINYTLMCLESIAAHLPSVPFEIIVVDDKSADHSLSELSKVEGITLLANPENVGFIRSCNRGAKAARGRYLCFLNNDTEVRAGWLDSLVQTFNDFPGTGLAGSKLLYPDGTLQEAGGIIWQDGSAWNFGRNQDPDLPVYNYAREVDYCSGASIMVPKVLFEEFGGFDEHYLPAYCEDSDLALKIRDKGCRVIYQPLSTVIHFEGITSGTDITQGTKAYQIENSKKLYQRWESRLQTYQANGMDADNAKDRRATRRVLVLDHCTPTPNQDSGSIDAYNIMLLLREMDFQVTFIPEDNFLYMPEYTTALQRVGIEVLYAPYVTTVDQHLKEYGQRYDLAFVFRPGVVERHLKAIRKLCPRAKVLFHTVDLHFLRMSREAALQSDKTKQEAADEMKQRELTLIMAADITTVVSNAELEMLSKLLPKEKIRLLPYSRCIEGTDAIFAERRDIVFIGGYQHTPNVDAVLYFVTEIMPLLRKQLPGVRFYAVGSKTPAAIQALACEDIIITGFIEDLPPLLEKMRVSVAPLRYGAGIKGKIGTAMALSLPVVATSLAAEGMGLTHGKNIVIADGPADFADAIARLYQAEELWREISLAALRFAEVTWGAEAAWGNLANIVEELGMPVSRKDRPLVLYGANAC